MFKGSEVLTTWRMEELLEYNPSLSPNTSEPIVYHEPSNRSAWPDDESSRNAEKYLTEKKQIKVPWRYGDSFGDDFKVIGLRAGGCGVVFFVESTKFGTRRLYAAKTLRKFLEKDCLSKSTYEQKQIADAFLEEALPWLEMGRHANIVAVHLLKSI
ncbi:MAG: hypothetical protein AABZ57_00995, partial [Candidatus Margulisiibacteriota bacterium]